MRYTTIIDISEIDKVWGNFNVVRLYLFLALKCGYHDIDRDFIQISTRTLALQLGISHSAVRHALKILQNEKLIAKAGKWWRIKKYVDEQPITKRDRHDKSSKQRAVEKAAKEAREANAAALEADIAARKQSKNGFIIYYENHLKLAEEGNEESKRIVEQRRGIYESIKGETK